MKTIVLPFLMFLAASVQLTTSTSTTTTTTASESAPIASTGTINTDEAGAVSSGSFPNASSILTDQEQVENCSIQDCKVMNWYNWNDVWAACQWAHADFGRDKYSLFYKFYSGKIVYECKCDYGLQSYDPWSSRWKFHKEDGVACWIRDNRSFQEAKNAFGFISCRRHVKNCDTDNPNGCVYC